MSCPTMKPKAVSRASVARPRWIGRVKLLLEVVVVCALWAFEQRRAEGVCLTCRRPADPGQRHCQHCWELSQW